jgi:hypothetical protein
MKHEELLYEINATFRLVVYAEVGGTKIVDVKESINALRNVVELHKPDKYLEPMYNGIETCPVDGDVYPCPTIQAVEKVLAG